MTGAAIIAMFESFTEITDLIGSGDNMRLYPTEIPQGMNTLPAVTYRRLPVRPVNDFESKSDFEFRSVDFHVHSKSYDTALSTLATIREELEGQSGTWAGVEVNHILYMTDSEDFDEDLETHIHQIELQFNYRR